MSKVVITEGKTLGFEEQVYLNFAKRFYIHVTSSVGRNIVKEMLIFPYTSVWEGPDAPILLAVGRKTCYEYPLLCKFHTILVK